MRFPYDATSAPAASSRSFGEAFRPQLELDYIERLLKD
jgi:hypothetical protein